MGLRVGGGVSQNLGSANVSPIPVITKQCPGGPTLWEGSPTANVGCVSLGAAGRWQGPVPTWSSGAVKQGQPGVSIGTPDQGKGRGCQGVPPPPV